MKNIAILIFWLMTISIFAQENTSENAEVWVEIELKDGSVLKGILLEKTEQIIRLNHEILGKIELEKSNVKNIKMLKKNPISNQTDSIFANPKPTVYFLMPTGFHVKEGEIYYQNQYLFLNSFEFGMHQNFSLKMGFEVISVYAGSPTFFIMPKYSISVAKKLRAGVTVLGLFMANSGDNSLWLGNISSVGAGIGFLTYGTEEANLTAGIGYNFGNGETSASPVWNLNGMLRLSKRVSFITENWFVAWEDSYMGIGSAGIRILGEKNAFDIGVIRPTSLQSDIEILGIPYVSFYTKF